MSEETSREVANRIGKRYAHLYQLLRDELQAVALEDAASWLDSAEQAQNIAFDGPSDLGALSAKYEAAIEDPAEWLRTRAAAIRGDA
jgi:hypothetical protein